MSVVQQKKNHSFWTNLWKIVNLFHTWYVPKGDQKTWIVARELEQNSSILENLKCILKHFLGQKERIQKYPHLYYSGEFQQYIYTYISHFQYIGYSLRIDSLRQKMTKCLLCRNNSFICQITISVKKNNSSNQSGSGKLMRE